MAGYRHFPQTIEDQDLPGDDFKQTVEIGAGKIPLKPIR